VDYAALSADLKEGERREEEGERRRRASSKKSAEFQEDAGCP
jgi:hypothetical protein